ncbi:DUF4893 domain-containing protein [Sphingomonas floccifaciens]|uniref:DUF4893 domain-containing protein n=1 Tax=Sphingomonas floccifaciens TaxID=1844115 RepID=A0ABW4N7B8_9SPHN
MTIAVLLAGLALCAAQDSAASDAAECRTPAAVNWREAATADDRTRIRTGRDSWTAALDTVRARGGSAAVASEGALLEPDRALGSDPVPPAGDYRCRTIKLGIRDDSRAPVAVQPALPCRIAADGGLLRLTQAEGAQRVNGLLYPDTTSRGVFLGTLALTDEPTPLRYGQDRMRDMAGTVERVAARRWRIVLPQPAFESTLDVIEVTPAG